jgi:putative cardiolipin synthase
MRFKPSVRTTSYAIPLDFSVALARLFKINPSLSNDHSHFLPIHHNDEALAWRLALIEQAEKTIDAQYYSWHADISGKLLINKLIEAADRGVRVRLLLDDIHTFGADRRIAILNQHTNIEVRLFNPFHLRWPFKMFRLFEFIWDIDRLNHRMHNKLLIADNVASIIGGRNIGDEYFGLNGLFDFRDLDLMVSGNAVDGFSKSFDLYWNSPVSKTSRRIIAFRPRRLDFIRMKKKLGKFIFINNPIIQRIENLKDSLITNPELSASLIQSESHIFYDLPEPGESEQRKTIQKLYQPSIDTVKRLTLISAYFVPSNNLIDSLKNMIDRGVKVQVFTNSLASIDVTAAFSGYERYRHRLLSMGIELFEFRADPEYHSTYSTPAINVKNFGLHAKSIIYDTSSVYVGTLNLDPRSASLNTEIGILVDSSALSNDIRNAFLKDLSEGQFWRVKYNDKGRLTWTCNKNSTTRQPARNLWQRLANFIYSRLPIQQQL